MKTSHLSSLPNFSQQSFLNITTCFRAEKTFRCNGTHRPRAAECLPLLFLVVSLPASLAAFQAVPSRIQWRVKAAGDEPFKRGSTLTLTMEEGSIRCERRGRPRTPALTIPTDRVTDVSDSVISGLLADKVYVRDELDYISHCGQGRWASDPYLYSTCVGAGIAGELYAFPMVIVLESFSFEDHFVHITWKDKDGRRRRVTFKVNKKDHALLMANLRARVGDGLEEDDSSTSFVPLSEPPAAAAAQQSRCMLLAPDSDEFVANCNLLSPLHSRQPAVD